MKKVIVVSKTHLDLGFTNYAETIRQTYIDYFIPGAISLANQMNTKDKKSFVWTTGSWIIKEALENGTEKQRENVKNALKNRDLVPHALPLTLHTELLDEDTLDYGLSIIHKLDEIRGEKTVSAKMTDVPGHTKGIVPMLAKHGIKLLHLGVNGASALAQVPPCFLWRVGDSEVVVIYSGAYGGAFKSDLIDEVLYFDHTLDNRGTPSIKKIQKKLQKIQAEFPDYVVEAGSMDEIARLLWDKRDKLPVVTDEIGDTWIHGAAADPYKSAALRELIDLKQKWLNNGTMVKDSDEYIGFTDALLCIAEHTCGMDMKMYFADYEHYLKSDFQKARADDKVVMKHLFRDFPQNFTIFTSRLAGKHRQGSYKAIENSWAEQRGYISIALTHLSAEHKKEANSRIKRLIPDAPVEQGESFDSLTPIKVGKWEMTLNEYGNINTLVCDGDEIISANNTPILEYRGFDDTDYDFWLKNYTRDIKDTITWCIGDFARPLLKYVKGKYPSGRFPYRVKNASKLENSILIDLECDRTVCYELGAPLLVQVLYTLTENGLEFEVSWFNKDANRLTEAMYLHLNPSSHGEISLNKLGQWINPYEIVGMGGKKLSAVKCVKLSKGKNEYIFRNFHSPLFSAGKGKILEYDNEVEDIKKDGISFVLHDNVWGTNFPLWYEDNAYFRFTITK